MADKDDDALLRSLGSLEAERQHESVRSELERLATGTLPDDELAELERSAAGDPQTKALLEAARPLDAEARTRIAGAIADEIAKQKPNVVRPRFGVSRRAGAVITGLALAAGLVLFVSFSGPGDLPPYALESSGASSSRAPRSSSSACSLTRDVRGSFEIVARSNDAARGGISARTFVVRDGQVQTLDARVEVSETGSVRVGGENRNIERATELVLVVGREPELAGERALAKARGSATSGRGWQVLRCSITN